MPALQSKNKLFLGEGQGLEEELEAVDLVLPDVAPLRFVVLRLNSAKG